MIDFTEDIILEEAREKHYEDKEFNLSEKIKEAYPDYYPDNIPVEDVKEFIRRVKENLNCKCTTGYKCLTCEIIDSLAGEKLK